MSSIWLKQQILAENRNYMMQSTMAAFYSLPMMKLHMQNFYVPEAVSTSARSSSLHFFSK